MNTFKPGVHPTFREQYDKVTSAYFEDKLKPMFPCACFVGNLLNGNKDWGHYAYSEEEGDKCIYYESNGLYEYEDVFLLEDNFLRIWVGSGIGQRMTEDSLFAAMNSTLDMLRKIHESAGEVTENYNFQKRALCNS